RARRSRWKNRFPMLRDADAGFRRRRESGRRVSARGCGYREAPGPPQGCHFSTAMELKRRDQRMHCAARSVNEIATKISSGVRLLEKNVRIFCRARKNLLALRVVEHRKSLARFGKQRIVRAPGDHASKKTCFFQIAKVMRQ